MPPRSRTSSEPAVDATREGTGVHTRALVFAPLSVLWTYTSLRDLAPHNSQGAVDSSPTEIQIRCLRCKLQWIAAQGTPGSARGDFEQINGHVRLVCPGCKAEGSIEVSGLMGGDDYAGRR